MAKPHYRGTWDDSGIAGLLGWKLLHEESGVVRATFEAREEFVNPAGAIAGGYLAAMLDMVTSAAVRSSLGPHQHHRATLEMKVNFINGARPGILSAERTVVHVGRSVGFAEGSTSSADGTLKATASATMRIVTE